ncbi:MAG: hypothetical protein AB7F98_08685 [Novosphingobium sp.]
MRLISLAIVAAMVSFPASAREPDKPVTQKNVTAGDVAATPFTDLNLRKGEIPPLLVAAEQQPYSLQGLATCQQLAAAIGEFDAILGDDLDVPQPGTQRTSAGRLAQSVVGSFIPFRGLIREVSGASKRQRELQAAILAGVGRRSFLKGIGQQRGCRYPARSITPEVYAQRMADIESGKIRDDDKDSESKNDRDRRRR